MASEPVAKPVSGPKPVRSRISAAEGGQTTRGQDHQRSDQAAEEPGGRNLVQVITRAAAILRALEGMPDGLSLAQIAGRVGLARSTVQRLAGALEAEQLLIAASPNGRVRLGPSLLRLAASVQTDFVTLARPSMARLAGDLGETVDFASLRRDHLVFLDQIVGNHRLRAVSAIGETFPLHCTANGKAVLAAMQDSAIEKLIGRVYIARTPHTMTSLDLLLREIAGIRKTGYAVDRQEHTLGICAAGVAMLDTLGNVVAISVPVPSQRFVERERVIAAALLKTKAELQSMISTLPRRGRSAP